MKKLLIWTLIAVVVLTLFWTINRKGATLNVSEAFFRYIFKNNMASGNQYDAEAFFLEIEGKDPSSKLLSRFRKYTPPVKKVSEYVSRIERIDTENGIEISYKTNGIKFRIDSYKWYGNIVVINGGYYEGNLSASWSDYIWMQIAGIWILIFAFPSTLAQH